MAIKFNMGESRDISVITAGGRKPNVDVFTQKKLQLKSWENYVRLFMNIMDMDKTKFTK